MAKHTPPLNKLTTILFVDAIEPCLVSWEALGYAPSVRVPDTGPLDFVILTGSAGELMLQTNKSLAEDLPAVSERKPSYALYGDVASLTKAKSLLSSASVLVARRKTFYGATESWYLLEGDVILGLAQHE
jgi:hypothetical protein